MQRRDFLRLLGTGVALGMMAPFADVLAAGSVTMPEIPALMAGSW